MLFSLMLLETTQREGLPSHVLKHLVTIILDQVLTRTLKVCHPIEKKRTVSPGLNIHFATKSCLNSYTYTLETYNMLQL